MNTGKQINVMLGLFIVFAVGSLLYFLWDTPRQEAAIERQTMTNSERGAELFALNCRSCHGLTGNGPIERPGSLPGAPLNLEANRGIDSETGEVSVGKLAALQRKFTDTITCGRIGTVMPPWSQEQGGPLNFFQIEQIVTLITGSKPVSGFDPSEDPNAVSEFGWEFVWEEANHADEFSPHVELIEAVGAGDTTIAVSETDSLKEGDILRLGGSAEEPEYELVTVTAISDGEITVERAVEGTTATEHAEGTAVFGNFVPPGTVITGDLAPVCGQSATGGGSDGEEAPRVAVDGSADVSMGDNFFEVDGETNPTLEVGVGEPITFDIVNGGAAVHNMRIAGIDNEYESGDDFVSDPDVMLSADIGTLTFVIDEAGTFDYRCDFHPIEMVGQISVGE